LKKGRQVSKGKSCIFYIFFFLRRYFSISTPAAHIPASFLVETNKNKEHINKIKKFSF